MSYQNNEKGVLIPEKEINWFINSQFNRIKYFLIVAVGFSLFSILFLAYFITPGINKKEFYGILLLGSVWMVISLIYLWKTKKTVPIYVGISREYLYFQYYYKNVKCPWENIQSLSKIQRKGFRRMFIMENIHISKIDWNLLILRNGGEISLGTLIKKNRDLIREEFEKKI